MQKLGGGGEIRCIMRDVQVAYITNQFDDRLPVGLLNQFVRVLHWYRGGLARIQASIAESFQPFFA